MAGRATAGFHVPHLRDNKWTIRATEDTKTVEKRTRGKSNVVMI